MKSFIVFLFMLFSLNAHTQGIEFFHGTFDEAKAESKKTGRLIFMDCFTTWCGPCKRLSSQVFTQEEVGNFFNKSFINVKFDMEKGEGPSIAKEYGISAYPTLLFIDGAGKLMHRKVGGTDPAGLIAEGQIAAKKNDLSPVYGAQFDAGDHSPELVYKYIKALNDAGKSSSKVANQYFKEKKNFDSQPDQMIIYEASNTLDSKAFELFQKNLKSLNQYYSPEEIDAKEKAVLVNTIDRAIEFQSNDLLTQIKTYAGKNLNKAEADYISTLADFKMADSKKNVAQLLTNANKFAEIANTKNKIDLSSVIFILKTKYSSDKSLQAPLLALYEKQADISGKAQDRLNYGMYLLAAGNKEKALVEVNKAKDQASAKREDTSTYENVIQYINSK